MLRYRTEINYTNLLTDKNLKINTKILKIKKAANQHPLLSVIIFYIKSDKKIYGIPTTIYAPQTYGCASSAIGGMFCEDF